MGVGHRFALGEQGAMDVGLSGATFVLVNIVRANADLIGYITQKQTSQFYVGIGEIAGILFGDGWFHGWYTAPNLIIGNEFLNSRNEKRFFQIETIYPVYFSGHEKIYIPLFTLKYGVNF